MSYLKVSLIVFLLISSCSALFAEYSPSLEFKYLTPDPQADGETDFRGETEIFDDQQRIDFLKAYGEYAAGFFGDPGMDTKVVTEQEVAALQTKIKPQPLPEVRQEHRLNRWSWLGVPSPDSDSFQPTAESFETRETQLVTGEEMIDLDERLSQWDFIQGVKLDQNSLLFTEGNGLRRQFASQVWRMSFAWRFKTGDNEGHRNFVLGDTARFQAIKIHLTPQGQIHCNQGNHVVPVADREFGFGEWNTFKVEIDIPNRAYTLYLNETRLVYAASLMNATLLNQIDTFWANALPGDRLDDILGIGYHPGPHHRLQPYTVKTFWDQDFQPVPDLSGWAQPDYSMEGWQQTDSLPLVFGGERHSGKDLYLRTDIDLQPHDGKAFLQLEALDPAGDIFINGTFVETVDRQPQTLDVTRYLRFGASNTLAIRVHHVPKGYYIPDGHTNSDMQFGSFAAEIALVLTAPVRLTDVFTFTRTITAEGAQMSAEIVIQNDSIGPFEGTAEISFYPWFPLEEDDPAYQNRYPVSLAEGQSALLKEDLVIPDPNLWTWQDPHLYRVVVTLHNTLGEAVDDLVVTTGIRTISQDDGIFRINGEPEMLNGALSFRFPAPIEKISEWNRCMPEEWLVKEIAMVKKLGGNALRLNGMSDHYADPRCARIGDQLGIMYLWTPTGWNRKEWTEGGGYWQGHKNLTAQLEEFETNVRQVRNHPSVVVWEVFDEGLRREVVDPLFEAFYSRFRANDPSRLFMFEKDYVRTEPMTTNGTYGWALDYGRPWSGLRNWPDGIREIDCAGRPMSKRELLNSTTQAYFDCETGELIGQPNWNLVRCKPWYHIHSYEVYADERDFGRILRFDEWLASQAWQAFGGYNLTKKQRLYGIDGMLWVVLRGGGNSVTYMKPLIDYHDHAKLAFYTFRSTLQEVFAGSDNVDTAYGPGDKVTPVIMNRGDACTVDLTIIMRNTRGEELDRQHYRAIDVKAHRGIKRLTPFKPKAVPEGCYAFEYRLSPASAN